MIDFNLYRHSRAEFIFSFILCAEHQICIITLIFFYLLNALPFRHV